MLYRSCQFHHLLFEFGAEGLQLRFQKPDVAAHHAEMGNLLSLYPKIHCLDADTQVHSGVANREWKFCGEERQSHGASARGIEMGEVLWIHAYL